MDGIVKPVTQRYRLQPFHTGFVRQALAAHVPVIPVAIVGSDDQAPILYDVKPLARRLGLPVAPITPTFPWLGPLGLLPLPVRYRIVYGAPIDVSARSEPVDEIVAVCRERIGGYKVPRSVAIRSEPLPKSGAGKILKRNLRDPYWAGRERRVN